jgi:hypothetical protein
MTNLPILDLMEGPITNVRPAKGDQSDLLRQFQVDLARIEKENDALRTQARALIWAASQAERKLRHLHGYHKGRYAVEIFQTAEGCRRAINGMQFVMMDKP